MNARAWKGGVCMMCVCVGGGMDRTFPRSHSLSLSLSLSLVGPTEGGYVSEKKKKKKECREVLNFNYYYYHFPLLLILIAPSEK